MITTRLRVVEEPPIKLSTRLKEDVDLQIKEFVVSSGGDGDMKQSVYDQNFNGIVDNAEKVNGFDVARNVLASEYTNDKIDELISESAESTEFATYAEVEALLNS